MPARARQDITPGHDAQATRPQTTRLGVTPGGRGRKRRACANRPFGHAQRLVALRRCSGSWSRAAPAQRDHVRLSAGRLATA